MAVSAGLVVVLRPYMVRYALARVNARSSHREPTPQGGGIAVVAATLGSAWLGAWLIGPALTADRQLLVISIASVVLAFVGALDDTRGLPATPRFVMQALAVGVVVTT